MTKNTNDTGTVYNERLIAVLKQGFYRLGSVRLLSFPIICWWLFVGGFLLFKLCNFAVLAAGYALFLLLSHSSYAAGPAS